MLEMTPEVMLSPAIERALTRDDPETVTTLTVTAEDMELALSHLDRSKDSLSHCAVATAIRRTFAADAVFFAYCDGHFYHGGKGYRVDGEEALGKFVHHFMEASCLYQPLPEPATFAITASRCPDLDKGG